MGFEHLLAALSPLGAAFALFRVEQARRSLRQSRRRIVRYGKSIAGWESGHGPDA